MPDYYDTLNKKLSQAEQEVNATYIRNFLTAKGWTLNAICGVLGNFESECTINPNVYEDYEVHSDDIGNYGYGLPQWTPWLGRYFVNPDNGLDYSTPHGQRNYHGTNSPTYGRWCIDNGYDKSSIDTQLEFIHQGLGGYSTKHWPEKVTWNEFIHSDRTPSELAKIFYRNYERSETGEYGDRPSNADNWWEFFGGESGGDGGGDDSGGGGGNDGDDPGLTDYPEAIASRAVQWASEIAEDDSHGYDQANRWGPDYDCSSLVIQAFEQGGCPVKTKGASSTANMREIFVKCGFTEYHYTEGMELISGDVLWREGHCAIYYGENKIISAHINELGTTTGGQTGDQTGGEINISWLGQSGDWEYMLRLTGEGGSADDDDNGNKPRRLSKLLLYAIATDYF